MDPTKFVLGVCGGIGVLIVGVFYLANRETPAPAPPTVVEVVERTAPPTEGDQTDKVTKVEEPVPPPMLAVPEVDPNNPPVDPKDPLAAFRKPSGSGKERFGFKKDTPGVRTLKEYRLIYRDEDNDLLKDGETIVAGVQRRIPEDVDFTIAGEDVSYAEYVFVDGVLGEIVLHIDEFSKRAVIDALTMAHGEPESDNAGHIHQWHATKGDIRVVDIGTGVLVRYEDKELRATLDARIDAAAASEKARKAKDL